MEIVSHNFCVYKMFNCTYMYRCVQLFNLFLISLLVFWQTSAFIVRITLINSGRLKRDLICVERCSVRMRCLVTAADHFCSIIYY